MHFPGRGTGPVPGCSCPKYSTYLLWEYRQRLQGQGAGRYGEFIALCVLGTLSGKAEQGGMAAGQLSLFPITAPGRQSLLPRVLPAPWDPSHRTVVNPCENRGQSSMDVLRQTGLRLLLSPTALSPLTPHMCILQARNSLSILPQSLHPAVTLLRDPALSQTNSSAAPQLPTTVGSAGVTMPIPKALPVLPREEHKPLDLVQSTNSSQ